MKSKSWFKYLIYMILFIGLIYLNGHVNRLAEIYMSETFSINFFLVAIGMLIKMFIGALLGIKYLLNEIKREGRWKINFPKILIMGIPSLYFSTVLFWMLADNKFVHKFIVYPASIFLKDSGGFMPIFQILLGYFLITSFYKSGDVN